MAAGLVLAASGVGVAVASYQCDDVLYAAQEPHSWYGGCWYLCEDDQGNIVSKQWCQAARVTNQLFVPFCAGSVSCPVPCVETEEHFLTLVTCACLLVEGCLPPGTHPVWQYFVEEPAYITCNTCPGQQ